METNVTKTKTLLYSQTAIILVLLFLLFKCCNENNDSVNPDEMPNLITYEQANEMHQLYVNNQYAFINELLPANYPDANQDYTRFSMSNSDLEDYITYANQVAEDNNKKVVGYRFFLGAIEDEETQVPYTTLVYAPLAIPENEELEEPIIYDDLPVLFEAKPGDKVGCGGNPPGNNIYTNGNTGNNGGTGSSQN